jgi:hypothetical protein
MDLPRPGRTGIGGERHDSPPVGQLSPVDPAHSRAAAHAYQFAAMCAPVSIIAKEKRLERDDAHLAGVAFMIKHGKGELKESGGWEFAYYPSAPQARYDGCVDCHRSGGSKDYVFSTLNLDRR